VSADYARLVAGWTLQRDFAVRSAGFPVSGLEVFGPGDETERLRCVARQPRFREAVTWQNPAALVNAVTNVAENAPTKPSRARGRQEIVASYWQRYCAKNDTIGFFGPLAWGRIADDGPALHSWSGALVRERAVHLEAWPVQELAAALDPELKVAAGPFAEHDLRTALEQHPDNGARERGLAALDRLEAARDAVASSRPECLLDALADLDAVFVELTGREPVRNAGRAYGARTLCYIDCIRDLDVTIGPGLLEEIAPALQVLFEAGSWYCGQVNEIGRRVIESALPDGGRGPFTPVLMQALKTLMQLPPELADEVAELQRRFAEVLADTNPTTVGGRAAAIFSDRLPPWRHAAFHSVDLQIAAHDEADVATSEWLAVIGDMHLGNNPLMQGVFAHRHPNPPTLIRLQQEAVGSHLPVLMPPFAPGMGVDARGMPLLPDDAIRIAAMPDTRAPGGRPILLPHELQVDGTDLVDRSGSLRLPLLDVFWLPIFISSVRTFDPQPEQDHAPRLTIGRTVLAREAWNVPATDVPTRPHDVAAFARDLGMPRRVFVKSPLERKPMYLDIDSPVLARIFCRHARHAAAESPQHRIRFTEMLPAPDQTWLSDADGNRYVSELRLVALDQRA
jgi:Lantibiotic dehydratase, N terminus